MMLGTLAQIVATFVALVLTLLAGYAIFLSTSRAQVDADIQEQGLLIVEELGRSVTYKPPYIPNEIFYWLEAYQRQHPNMSGIALLKRLAEDLLGVREFVGVSLSQSFGLEQNKEISKKERSRIALGVAQHAVSLLVPSEDLWPGPRPGIYPWRLPDLTKHDRGALFPFGPLGAERWAKEFGEVRDVVKLIASASTFEEPFDESRAGDFRFKDWRKQLEQTMEKVEPRAIRVASLLTLKETFRFQTPNLRWFFFLSGFLFVVGVIVPLAIVGLRPEPQVPPVVNLVLLGVTVIVSGGIGWLAKDMVMSPERRVTLIRYLVPLRDRMRDEEKHNPTPVVFEVDFLSRLLDNETLNASLSLQEREALKEYKKAIHERNSASHQLAISLEQALQSSEIFARHRGEESSGGTVFHLFQLLDRKNRKEIINRIQLGEIITICRDEASYERVIRYIVTLQVPAEDEQRRRVLEELDLIYEKISAHEEYRKFADARTRMEQMRKRILEWLDQKTKDKSEKVVR